MPELLSVEDDPTQPDYIISCKCRASLFHIVELPGPSVGVMCIECDHIIPFNELDSLLKPETVN